MNVDLVGLLRSAADDVLIDPPEVEIAEHTCALTLLGAASTGRRAVIRVSPEWITLEVPELDVGGTAFDDLTDDAAYTWETMRLTLVAARTYLEGGGVVRPRRRPFRRQVLTIEAAGLTWQLGRTWCRMERPR